MKRTICFAIVLSFAAHVYAQEVLPLPAPPSDGIEYSQPDALFDSLAEPQAWWESVELLEQAFPIEKCDNVLSQSFPVRACAAELGKCACGKKCQCAAGKRAEGCKCGANCQCAKGACACGTKCRCASGKRADGCKCGKGCACAAGKLAVAKCDDGKCGCGANCQCGQKKIAKLQRQLDAAHQHIEYQQHIANLRAESQIREQGLVMELMEAKAVAAGRQAALEQQLVAQQQQNELVGKLVELAQSGTKQQATDGHLQHRIEQLTIENVQLRKTIEELRVHIEQIARQPKYGENDR